MTIFPSRNCAETNLALWQPDFETTTCVWDVCAHDEQSGERDICKPTVAVSDSAVLTLTIVVLVVALLLRPLQKYL